MQRHRYRLLLSCIILLWLDAYANEGPSQTIRAATTDDVINAMIIANKTHIPTVIRLVPGRYVFSRGFPSRYDGNLLPVVTGTIRIIGRDPATTSFEPAANGRFFTILGGGNLSVYNLTLQRGFEACPESFPDCALIAAAPLTTRAGRWSSRPNLHFP